MPADRTRRTTTLRDAAEAAFKAATTKPAELPPKRPTIPNAKELVTSADWLPKLSTTKSTVIPGVE
jgi:hypothetical protein